MKENIIPSLSYEALYNKSKLYIQRGLKAKSNNNLDEYQLWASLAIELLAKASLAQIHPSLIVDPTHQNSIFAACGLNSSLDVRTITAKTLFDRLSHRSGKFDTRVKKFCDQLSLQRNAELHSGESPFLGKIESWEDHYWNAIQLILSLQDKDLKVWLGAEDAKAPENIIEEAKNALSLSIIRRIKHSKENFEKEYHNKKKREQIIKDSYKIKYWNYEYEMCEDLEEYYMIECPSCSSQGIFGGVVLEESVEDAEEYCYDQDEYYSSNSIEYVIKQCRAEEFFCPTCDLRLHGIEEIEAAGLESEFQKEEERVREFQMEYGNE